MEGCNNLVPVAQGDAGRDHLENEFEHISMQGDEDPELLFARVEGKLNVLSALGIYTSDLEVVHILTRRRPPKFYDVDQRISLACFVPVSRDRRCRKSSAPPT